MKLKTALITSGALLAAGAIGSSFLTDENASSPQIGDGWDEHTVAPEAAEPNTTTLDNAVLTSSQNTTNIRRYVPTNFRGEYQHYKRFPRRPGNPDASSVGQTDTRLTATLAIQKYDSIALLTGTAGDCTASIKEVFGYQSTNGKPIALTARHCIEDQDPSTITVKALTIDLDGKPYVYETGLSNFAYPAGDERRDDIAILELAEPLPEFLIPGQFKPNYNFLQDQEISVLGYGADNAHEGLTGDPNCNVLNQMTADCDIVSGVSGAPVNIPYEDARLYSGALTSGAWDPDQKKNDMVMVTISSQFLDRVPFLERADTQPINAMPVNPYGAKDLAITGKGYDCLMVDVGEGSYLNGRSGPGTEFNIVAQYSEGIMLNEVENLGQWSVVEGKNGDASYINNQYTVKVQHCRF